MNTTAALAGLMLLTAATFGQTLLGPTPYLCEFDSPWNTAAPGFYLERFEGATFTVPGVSGNGNFTSPSGITDSVDCDDGVIDGSGTAGRSYFGAGNPGLTFNFGLPRPQRVGIVWTDGVHNSDANSIHFEAFAANGTSLGQIDGGHADNVQTGGTAEDRFYGVEYAPGIASFRIWQTSGCCGIEVDHLQFGPIVAAPACDPDFNCDGNADQDDVACLINVVAGNPGCECQDPDFTRDGNVDQDDVAAMITSVAGGGCP